jgi:hypothetical protein
VASGRRWDRLDELAASLSHVKVRPPAADLAAFAGQRPELAARYQAG